MKKWLCLNLCCGYDKTGTDWLDLHPRFKGVIKQDLNKNPILPWDDETFNEVIFLEAIEYMLYPQKILEEIYRVLKKGYILRISTFNCQSKRFLIKALKDRYNPKGWSEKRLSMYDEHTLSNRLKITGFKIIKISYKRIIFPFNDYFEIIAKK